MRRAVVPPVVRQLAARARRLAPRPPWTLGVAQPGDDPVFLFILTPPYAGSTVLAKILTTSPSAMLLTPQGEGQWLVATLRKRRWDADRRVDWPEVRRTWLQRYADVQALVGTVSVVVDKSPPHMVRAHELRDAFPSSVFVCFNRHPYAYVASALHRRYPVDRMRDGERLPVVASLAQEWLHRGRLLRAISREWSLPRFTYEEFCADPAACVRTVQAACPQLGAVDVGAQVAVKDYDPQGIVDQNPRQIALLGEADRGAIAAELRDERDVLEFFGYEVA